MKVPLLDLEAQYRPIRSRILEAITRVCDSQRFILGPEVEALERELARQIGAADAVAMSSGNRGRQAGTLGVAACFSFSRARTSGLSAMPDG